MALNDDPQQPITALRERLRLLIQESAAVAQDARRAIQKSEALLESLHSSQPGYALAMEECLRRIRDGQEMVDKADDERRRLLGELGRTAYR